MTFSRPKPDFRVVSPEETDRHDDYLEPSLVKDVFQDYIPEVVKNPNFPYINDDTYVELSNLVKERKFFCFWLTSIAKGIPEEDEDGEIFYPDSEHTSFHEPKDQIVEFICKWLDSNHQNLDREVVEEYFKKTLRKQEQNYFDDEYYGDSSDYTYLSIDKQDFIKDIQLFAEKSLQAVTKEKPLSAKIKP